MADNSLTLALVSDTGFSTTDDITSDAALDGTAAAGATVSLFDGTTALGSTIAAGDGTWSFASPALADGAHTILATTTGLGTGPGAASLAFTLDTTAPVTTNATITVSENSAPASIGIAAPYDLGTPAAALAVTIEALPADGTVTLGGSGSPVSSGEAITGALLATLDFTPAPGAFGTSAPLGYVVTDAAGNSASGTTTLAIGPPVGSPVLQQGLAVLAAENSMAIPLGLAAPGDANFAADQLAITVATLPGNGTLTLGGTTPVSMGQSLSLAQLLGLMFTPAAGQFDSMSVFSYSVTDPAQHASTGNVTLSIGHAVGSPVPAIAAAVIVTDGAAGTALQIAAPTDPNYPAGDLAVTVLALPTNGRVTLADGASALTAGEALSVGQLTGLLFTPTPTPGGMASTSSLGYSVTDPDGNSAIGTVTLATEPEIATVGAIAATASVAGPLDAGRTVSFAATVTDPVVVGGTPALVLDNGASATYDAAASTPTSLVFDYTVAGGGDTADLKVTGLALDGGSIAPVPTISPAGAGIFDATGIGTAPGADTGIEIDTVPPVVSSPAIVLAAAGLSDASVAAVVVGAQATVTMGGVASGVAFTASADFLPTNGTITLADGTPVIQGETLTATQFAGLLFHQEVGAFGTGSSFGYTVSDPAGNTASGSASFTIGPVTTVPVLPAGSSAVYVENTPAAGLGIPAPSDVFFGPGPLVITAATLPDDGTVTLDGITPVTVGETLTASQLGGLMFAPSHGAYDALSSFTYSVSDPAGQTSTGFVPLDIGRAVGDPVPGAALPLTAIENAWPAPMLVGEPSDPNFALGDLTITVTGLPADGSVTLDDTSAVTLGETLTGGQFAGLMFAPAAGASEQTSTFTYEVSDPDYNNATASVTLAIGPPPPSVPLLSPASDSGVAGANATNDITPTITGTGHAGDSVRLQAGPSDADGLLPGTVIGIGTVDDNGQWSVVSSKLADGRYTVTAVQADSSGKASPPSGTLLLDIDTVAPSPTIPSQTASDGIVGVAEPGSSVTIGNGTTVLGVLGTTGTGGWAFLPSILAPGSYALTATVTDVAGNASLPSAAVAVEVAADHSFTIDNGSTGDGGGIGSLPMVSSYGDTDLLQAQVTTQPDGSVVTRSFNASGALVLTNTVDAAGLLAQSVSPDATTRNIYDGAGTLIGTVAEAGVADGVAPAGYLTAAAPLGASTVTDMVPNIVSLLSENQALSLTGSDTVFAGSGEDTITAGILAASVSGGSGRLTFQGGVTASTVSGGTGSATLYGGTGGGSYAGGASPGNLLVAAGGNTTLIGGGGTDVLIAGPGATTLIGSTAGHDTMVGGAGSDTIVAGTADAVYAGSGQSTVYASAGGYDTVIGAGNDEVVGAGGHNSLFGGAGSDTLFAGDGGNVLVGGTGASVLVGGSGSTDFIGGTGASTVSGGAGSDTVWTGAGTMTATLGDGADTTILQSGNASIFGGVGPDLYDVVNANAGGRNVISGFKIGIDTIALYGYPAPATVVVAGGNTTLGLGDGTSITLLGITHLDAGSLL